MFMSCYIDGRDCEEVSNETITAFGNTAEEARAILHEALCEEPPWDNPYYGEREKPENLFVTEVKTGEVHAF